MPKRVQPDKPDNTAKRTRTNTIHTKDSLNKVWNKSVVPARDKFLDFNGPFKDKETLFNTYYKAFDRYLSWLNNAETDNSVDKTQYLTDTKKTIESDSLVLQQARKKSEEQALNFSRLVQSGDNIFSDSEDLFSLFSRSLVSRQKSPSSLEKLKITGSELDELERNKEKSFGFER